MLDPIGSFILLPANVDVSILVPHNISYDFIFFQSERAVATKILDACGCPMGSLMP
jgi:hypothetical protein